MSSRSVWFGYATLTAVVALVVAQCFVVKTWGEPYPALLMPAFDGSGGYAEGKVHLFRCELVLVTPDREHVFTSREFLSDLPDSMHTAVISRSFLPFQTAPAETTRSANDSPGAGRPIFPGYKWGLSNRGTPESQAALKAWLEKRAHVLLPSERVVRVEIRWYQDVARIDGGKLVIDRTPSTTLSIPFDGNSA